jgi:hypothetical protein
MATAATRFGVVLASVMLLASRGAHADDEANQGQARALGQQAYAAAGRGDWAKAEELFVRAEALYHAPTLVLGLARARAHLGKYVEAWEDYHRILIETLPANANAALRRAVDEARTEIVTVEGKRSRVTINVSGAAGSPPLSPSTTHVAVTLDGASLPVAGLGAERPVNPGTHALHVEADGFKPSDTSFTVAEGAADTESVQLHPADAAPAPAPAAAPAPVAPVGESTATPSSPWRTVGLVTAGVGAAGLVVGAITGAMAIGDHNSLQSSPCANAGCGSSDLSHFQSTASSYQTLTTVSTISFIAGGVLAAGGAVLFFAAPKPETAAGARAEPLSVRPYLGLGGGGVAGSF